MIRRLKEKWAKLTAHIEGKINAWVDKQIIFGLLKRRKIVIVSELIDAGDENTVWVPTARQFKRRQQLCGYLYWYFAGDITIKTTRTATSGTSGYSISLELKDEY